MTTAAAAPRTTGNMAAGFLCSKLCPVDQTHFYISLKKNKTKTKGRLVARHFLYNYEAMSLPVLRQSCQTLVF